MGTTDGGGTGGGCFSIEGQAIRGASPHQCPLGPINNNTPSLVCISTSDRLVWQLTGDGSSACSLVVVRVSSSSYPS